MRTGEFEVEGGGRYLMYPLPSFCNKNAIHITLRGPSFFFHDLKYPLPLKRNSFKISRVPLPGVSTSVHQCQ
jgi:hypothetical protein